MSKTKNEEFGGLKHLYAFIDLNGKKKRKYKPKGREKIKPFEWSKVKGGKLATFYDDERRPKYTKSAEFNPKTKLLNIEYQWHIKQEDSNLILDLDRMRQQNLSKMRMLYPKCIIAYDQSRSHRQKEQIYAYCNCQVIMPTSELPTERQLTGIEKKITGNTTFKLKPQQEKKRLRNDYSKTT